MLICQSINGVYSYQLDLITPGSLACEASVRKQIRQIPNFLKYPLGRPQMGHRLYLLTVNFGSLIAFVRSDFFAKSSSFGNPDGHITGEVVQRAPSIPKRHPHQPEQLLSFRVRLCGGYQCNIHPFDFVDFVIIDLREYNMFLDPE